MTKDFPPLKRNEGESLRSDNLEKTLIVNRDLQSSGILGVMKCITISFSQWPVNLPTLTYPLPKKMGPYDQGLLTIGSLNKPY